MPPAGAQLDRLGVCHVQGAKVRVFMYPSRT
jgi:hypothetical protein